MRSYLEIAISSSSIEDKMMLTGGESAPQKNGYSSFSLIIPFSKESPPSIDQIEIYRQKLIGVAYKVVRHDDVDKFIYSSIAGFKTSMAIQTGTSDQTVHVAIQLAVDEAMKYLNELISTGS